MRHIPYLNHDQTLFREIELVEPSFVPEQLNHRDAQIQELAFLISPAFRGARPMNAILRGPPGTGKTTTIRWIFADIIQETGRILPAYGNCRQNTTPASVYRRIFTELFGYAPPSTGRSLEDIREAIATRLADAEAILLVCFDEADSLVEAGTYNTLLYQILRLYERWDTVRAPGVIAVTSDLGMHLSAEADASVRPVFHPREIFFPPYTRTEIREILGERVRRGLYPRVMPKVILERIAGITVREQDIRIGIALIKAAVLQAETDGRHQVTHDDLHAAIRLVTAPVLEARAAGLSPGERSLLCQIAEHSLAGEEMLSGAVFEAAREYLPIAKSTYHEHLEHLKTVGIVDLMPRSGRGREREVRLRYDPADVVAVCRGSGLKGIRYS